MDNPQPSTSKGVVESGKRVENRKRKAARSPSSSSRSSSSSSSSSSTSSSSSSDHGKRRRRKKIKVKSKKDSKLDQLINEVYALKNQLAQQRCSSFIESDNHEENYIDPNISGELYGPEPLAEEQPAPRPAPQPQHAVSAPLPQQAEHDDAPRAHADQAQFNLSVSTKLKEPSVPKASAVFLERLKKLQRFNDEEWSSVRYSEVQKQYVHSPGFINLEPNDEVKSYDSSKFSANMEKAFAGITYALLKQQDTLQNELRKFLSWAREVQALNYEEVYTKLNEIFSKSEYSKVSSDTFQLVCGHRAELVQHRREAILASVKDSFHKNALRKVPPSCSTLFEADKFNVVLEKAGGMRNVFWPKDKDRYFSAPQNDRTPSSSAQATTFKKFPKQIPHTKNETRPTARKNNNYKAFRGRGGKYTKPRDEDFQRKTRPRSPTSHRDKRTSSHRKY